MNDSRPTLLLFTLGPKADARRRPLLPAALGEEEVRLRGSWIEDIVDAGRGAGCRILVSCDRRLDLPDGARRIPQRGDGFAGRLADALARAGSADGPVIVVGADAPDLSADHLRRTQELLDAEPGAVVLGPAQDGGLYLLASERNLAPFLDRVRWCGPHALNDLRQELERAAVPCLLLAPLTDLDQPSDFERWLAGPGHAPVDPRLLGRLAARRRPCCPTALDLPGRRATAVPTGRAPPLAPAA